MVDDLAPRQSLPAGHGSGTLLGAAAGDVAGGSFSEGYSAVGQQLIVATYHLMRYGEVRPSLLIEELAELGHSTDGPSLYRRPSPVFAGWIAAAVRHQIPPPTEQPTSEPAVLAIPIGIWCREDPDGLVDSVGRLVPLFTADSSSLVAAAAVAGGVAASALAQSGPDLLAAGAETAHLATTRLEIEDPDALSVSDRLRQAGEWLGRVPMDAATALSGEVPGGIDHALLSLVLAAPVVREPHRLIEGAAAVGGSLLGALTGAMVGGRVGNRTWPWEIPNDSWFAELGRRLSRRSREFVDLPIPSHAEEYLATGRDERLYRI